MRLAILTDEISQNLDVALATARSEHFDGIEVRSVWNTPPHLLTDWQLTEIRAAAEAAGRVVVGFSPPTLKSPLPDNDDEFTSCRALLVDSVRRARLLGAPLVRIFSFYRRDDPDPELAGAVTAELIAGLDTAGLTLVVETGTRTNTPTMTHLLRFLEVVNDVRVGILWDPGNSVFSGWDATPFPEDYARGRELIRHVHVKDPDGRRGYVRLGDGDLPWLAILTRLAGDGYRGFVSLETHWRIGRRLSQRERDEPWGDGFSAGGLAASTQCMRRLRAMAGELS